MEVYVERYCHIKISSGTVFIFFKITINSLIQQVNLVATKSKKLRISPICFLAV